MDKYKKYEIIKQQLQSVNFNVSTYQEINYGIQFDASKDGVSSKVRIYESKKKGITVDLSQVKNELIKEIIFGAGAATPTGDRGIQGQSRAYKSDDIKLSLIGVDESGKGDYFGPLVVAGVYADEALKVALMKMGVADSKKLSDVKILELATRIKAICPCEVLCINNVTYNRLYHEINNLNYLLAWGHSKVIEKLWEKTKCELALSDQFAKDSIIKKQLDKKQISITLEERPRAEENVVVAAASILARAKFVEHMSQMEKLWGQAFPKGASTQTVSAAKMFVRQHGKEKLNEVAKLHFKTTEAL